MRVEVFVPTLTEVLRVRRLAKREHVKKSSIPAAPKDIQPTAPLSEPGSRASGNRLPLPQTVPETLIEDQHPVDDNDELEYADPMEGIEAVAEDARHTHQEDVADEAAPEQVPQPPQQNDAMNVSVKIPK